LLAVLTAGAAGCAFPQDRPINRISIICDEVEYPGPDEARASKPPGPCSGWVMDINATPQEKLAVERAGGEDGIILGGLYAICAANSLDEVLAGFPETPERTIADGIAGALILCPDSPAREDLEAYIDTTTALSAP
jgi:hypothetical protein